MDKTIPCSKSKAGWVRPTIARIAANSVPGAGLKFSTTLANACGNPWFEMQRGNGPKRAGKMPWTALPKK